MKDIIIIVLLVVVVDTVCTINKKIDAKPKPTIIYITNTVETVKYLPSFSAPQEPQIMPLPYYLDAKPYIITNGFEIIQPPK